MSDDLAVEATRAMFNAVVEVATRGTLEPDFALWHDLPLEAQQAVHHTLRPLQETLIRVSRNAAQP